MQLKKAKADFLSRIVEKVVEDEPLQTCTTSQVAEFDLKHLRQTFLVASSIE